MKTSLFTTILHVVLAASLYGQSGSINNTLGSGGKFTIKSGTDTLLSLSQSDGRLTLPVTTSSSLGVIYKGADRFIHDFRASGTNGYNTFLGINAGNFTMSGSGPQASYNTGIGYSLYSLTTGYENTAVGFNSLSSNTTGYFNTAVGVQSLNSNTDGYSNTAVGLNSLYSNTTGSLNTAVGLNSLFTNTTGYDNTALGLQSLFTNTTGFKNTALGYNSLYSNTTGYENTALGYQSLYLNTTGHNNTALGIASVYANTSGINNTALGNYSLSASTTGYDNTALGWYSGSSITTGSNLTLIGSNAQPTTGAATNQITLGSFSVTSLRCAVTTITAISDARDKKNITDLNLGLDFISKLKPRQFNWDKREWYENNVSDGSKMKETPTAGFIAQELDEVQTTQNAEWLNLVLKDNPEKLEATPGNLLPIMVKAIQELKTENETLRNELVTLRRSIAEQVKEEVQAALLKGVQPDNKASRVSLNETRD